MSAITKPAPAPAAPASLVSAVLKRNARKIALALENVTQKPVSANAKRNSRVKHVRIGCALQPLLDLVMERVNVQAMGIVSAIPDPLETIAL